jgi:hypothetical protein
MLLALTCMATAAVMVMVLSFVPAAGSRRPAQKVTTGLEVERRPRGDLRLSWNHAAPSIANATSGTLLIDDGAAQRTIALDKSVLSTGSLLYSPTSEEVLITLTVQGPEDSATDSVMIVNPKATSRK